MALISQYLKSFQIFKIDRWMRDYNSLTESRTLLLWLLILSILALYCFIMPAGFLDRWWRGTLGTSVESQNIHDGSREESPQHAKHEEGPSITLVGDEEAETTAGTPKAVSVQSGIAVPTLSLDDGGETDISTTAKTESTRPLPTLSVTNRSPSPASKSPSIASSKPFLQALSPGLMPPPPRAPQSLRTPPSQSSGTSLRVPSTGPLPNRGPPVNSQQRAGSSNARGKVLLAPGHSPMDWASLSRSSNLSGVPSFRRVTPSELKAMNGRKGKPAWSIWQGKVYNITPYLPFHPGGQPELLRAAGRDGTKLFMDIHPWVNWEGMLSACLVGVMVSEVEVSSSLDEID